MINNFVGGCYGIVSVNQKIKLPPLHIIIFLDGDSLIVRVLDFGLEIRLKLFLGPCRGNTLLLELEKIVSKAKGSVLAHIYHYVFGWEIDKLYDTALVHNFNMDTQVNLWASFYSQQRLYFLKKFKDSLITYVKELCFSTLDLTDNAVIKKYKKLLDFLNGNNILRDEIFSYFQEIVENSDFRMSLSRNNWEFSYSLDQNYEEGTCEERKEK